MPAFMKLGDIKGESTDSVMHKPFTPQTFVSGANSIASKVRELHPGGAKYVLITPSRQTGFTVLSGENGIIAILIGLLLPAVQKIRASSSSAPEVPVLKRCLKPGGKMLVARTDLALTPYAEFEEVQF
jgi:hypothetical protein